MYKNQTLCLETEYIQLSEIKASLDFETITVIQIIRTLRIQPRQQIQVHTVEHQNQDIFVSRFQTVGTSHLAAF